MLLTLDAFEGYIIAHLGQRLRISLNTRPNRSFLAAGNQIELIKPNTIG